MAKTAVKAEPLLERASPSQLRKLIAPNEDESIAAGAFKVLARSKPAEALELGVKVLANRRFGPTVRSAAAVELGKAARTENEQALLAQLTAREPEVVRHVVKALGRIGGEKTLQRLARFKAPEAGPIAEAIDFARTLIAYRIGSTRYLVPPPPISEMRPPPPAAAFALPVRTLSPKRVEPMLDKLHRQLPAIAPSRRNGLAITCGASEYRVLLSADTDEADISALLARPLIAGAIFKYRVCSERFSLDAYLLSSPGPENYAHVYGIRPSGVMVLAGVATLANQKLVFEVATTRSPHFRKMRLKGEVTQSGRFRALEAEGSREIADDGHRRLPRRQILGGIDSA